jgi:hypothetical protein
MSKVSRISIGAVGGTILLLIVGLLCVVPSCAEAASTAGAEQEVNGPSAAGDAGSVDLIELGPEWSEVADGVWEKVERSGMVQRRLFGLSGLRWKLDHEREKLVDLLDEYAVVRSGMESRAETLLARIRKLEETERTLLAGSKVGHDSDSGTNTRCSSSWGIDADCTFWLAYSFGAFTTATFTDPMCSATADTYSYVQSDLIPAGVSDSDVYSVGPTGSGGTAQSCARLYCGALGCDYDQWYHIEGDATVVYGTFINYGFYSVECEQDWAL